MHLITNPSDIYYLTGVRSHDAGEILMLQMNNEEGIMKNEGIVLCDARTSALFDREKYEIIDDRKKWGDAFKDYPELSTDPDFLTQTLREKIEKYGVQFHMQKSPITQKRFIKTPEEIQKLRTSQEMNKKVYEQIFPFLVPGVTEAEIARRIQILQLELGASGPSFPPIVAFGENTAVPHHSPTARVLHDGDVVLVDMGLVYEGYCSDMTRTHIFSGTFDSKSTQNSGKQINSLSSSATDIQISGRSRSRVGGPLRVSKTDSICSQTLVSERQEIIQLLENVTREIISWAKPGMKVAELDKKARDMLGEYEPYFTHSLGHGVGIDIHEAPWISVRSDEVLQSGMVITIEPGVYFPQGFLQMNNEEGIMNNEGSLNNSIFGVRYEEMVIVDKNGLIVI